MSDLANGNYFTYLVHRHRTRKQLKSTKPRFNRELTNLTDPFENGVYSRPSDLLYERPSKTQSENISLYAANDDNQRLMINLQWTPFPDENCGLIRVQCRFYNLTSIGVIYEYKKSKRIYNLDQFNDYSIGGFRLEIFSPLKRIKIRLNDFCSTIKDETEGFRSSEDWNEYQYVRLIAILMPVQEIFDNLTMFDSKFVSAQLSTLSQSFPLTDLADFGSHLRLLISTDRESNIEINLWGLRSKLRFNQEDQQPKQLIKFSGYAIKKGYNFSITFVENNGLWFKNGFSGWGSPFIFPIVSTSATHQLITENGKFEFTIANEHRKFTVKGEPIKDKPFYTLSIDDCPGIGYHTKLPFTGNEAIFHSKIEDFGPLIDSIPCCQTSTDLVVNIDQMISKNSELTGGKGSSLARLTSIVVDHPQLGQVPSGLVVTTKAYELMSQKIGLTSLIDKLKRIIRIGDESALEAECCSLVEKVGSIDLLETVREAIGRALTQLFDFNWVNNIKLAVRSSAHGEDSNELSCAGQMETFLGISTLDQVYRCVMKCWASQFRFIAVKYKLLNGLDLNLKMAVVIQEMVDCDQAGVLFTCDPVTGHPLTTLITANYGLGESIVSSTSDPDTIRVKLEMSANGLTIDSIEDVQIGNKEKIIKVSPTGQGTVTIESSDSRSCCLSENQIINLTSTCLKFASFFNGPCDIEWGIQSDQIYLFQCRPVTTVASNDLTDWELSCETDTAHVGSNEYHTRANLGEVYPGTTSYICQDFLLPASTFYYVKKVFSKVMEHRFMPYVARGFAFSRHHNFFSMKDGVLLVYDSPPEKENAITSSMEYALLGQKVNDYDMKEDSYERLTQWKPLGNFTKLRETLSMLFLGPRRVRSIQLDQFPSKVDPVTSTSHQMLQEILSSPDYLWKSLFAHLSVTIGSSIMNLVAISVLTRADKNNPAMMTDFSRLLSSCDQVISAQIPILLRELASAVTDEGEKNLILNSTDKEIVEYLDKGTSQLANKYRQFIQKNGHRGWKEFDFSGQVWRKNSSLIINPLRSMIRQQELSDGVRNVKQKISDEKLIDSLETPLSRGSKFLLRRFVLPLCRKFVIAREEGKNRLIWKYDQMRKFFDLMAEKLAYEEHRLPYPSLAYYLTPDELYQITQSSNPGLVALAKRRQKILLKMESDEFPIIIVGPKMLPNNLVVDEPGDDNYNGGEIIGTPVSRGKIKSTVFVAKSIEEAFGIKPGDILITYSTDIGWSPYFPIIGGLITEIGGLISHGAVIAREFGLPCVVGVKNACQLFKSGDLVSMDASKGIIVKMVDPINQEKDN